jgi:hypothetical protein
VVVVSQALGVAVVRRGEGGRANAAQRPGGSSVNIANAHVYGAHSASCQGLSDLLKQCTAAKIAKSSPTTGLSRPTACALCAAARASKLVGSGDMWHVGQSCIFPSAPSAQRKWPCGNALRPRQRRGCRRPSWPS